MYYLSQNQPLEKGRCVKSCKTMFLTIAMILFSLLSFAQNNIVVTGKVSDSKGLSIPGVSVTIQGTKIGTTTDFDGIYTLRNVNPNAALVFTFVGMETYTVKVANQKNINAIMKETTSTLSEVVVVGFGTQKKSNLTGAVSQVKMEDVLGNRAVSSTAAALQGAVPGLVVTTSPVPGGNATFNIRGTTSITQVNGVSAGPLVLIDNAEGDINMLNPQDIESVSVLKDAASTAIYGAKASFGVVLITTKRAKKNTKPTFNYNDNFAFSNVTNQIEQATVPQIVQMNVDYTNTPNAGGNGVPIPSKWLTLAKDYEANPGNYPADGRYFDPADNTTYYLKDNDPMNQIFDNHGFQQMHNFSAAGGSDKTTYRMSLGTVNNDGPLVTDKDSYKRYNISSYINTDLTKWLTTSLDFKYNNTDQTSVNSTTYPYYRTFARYYPVGQLGTVANPTVLYPIYNDENLLRLGNPDQYNRKETRVFSRTVLTPFKGFEGVLEYTLDAINSDTKTFSKNIQMIESNQNVNNVVPVPIYANNKGTQDINNLNAYISYAFDIKDKHHIKFLQGFSQGRIVNAALNVNRKDMISDQLPSISTGTGEILASDVYTDATTRSTFYRATYNYMEKYLLEANGRYDGSSKFPTLTRYGFFPSFSAGWQVGKENFMAFSKNWLSEFKLRASWGQIGNQNIANYGYYPEMTVMNPRPGWIQNGAGTLPVSLNMPPLVRTDYTWEVVETTNFGADLSLFKNRFQATADVYTRKTIGMLTAGAQLPDALGASAPQQNAADLKVNGWELAVNWRDKIGKVSYRIGANMFDSQTVITKYGNTSNDLGQPYYVGKKLGEIWGYKNDGFYTIGDFKPTEGGVNGWQNNVWNLKDGVVATTGYNPRPGDTKYKNLTDDSALTSNKPNQINGGMNTLADHGDQTVIGNSALRYQYGINGGVSYHGFDFSFMMNGVGKRDVWINDALAFPATSFNAGTTLYSHQVDNYWQPIDATAGNWEPKNPNAFYPRIYGQTNTGSGSSVNGDNNYKVQDKYLQNGAYLRLQNVSLSYSVPADLIKKAGIDMLKFFVSADNVHTWDHLEKGRDPESLGWAYPYYRTTSFGMNMTF